MTTPLTVYYPYKQDPTTYYVTRLEVPIYKEVNSQSGTTYTFLASDNGKILTANNINPQTYTIPLGLLSIGNRIEVLNINSGIVTIQGAMGVTLTGIFSMNLGERIELEKLGTNTWISRRLDSIYYSPSSILPLNQQTGSTYSFVLTDVGKLVTAKNINPQTYSIPLDSSVPFVTGNAIQLLNIGSGLVTVEGVFGVTFAGQLTLEMGQRLLLEKRAANNWFGSLLDPSQFITPEITEPNLSGPIIDPNNTSFSKLIDKKDEYPNFDAIMVVNNYLENESFGRISIEFNGRLRLGEIVTSNDSLIIENIIDDITTYTFPSGSLLSGITITSIPTLLINYGSGFVIYDGDLRHQYLFPFMSQFVNILNPPFPTSPTTPSPKTNRYATCSGIIYRGVVKEIRKYTFSFTTKDFVKNNITNEYTFSSRPSLDVDSGTSKILSGSKITSAPTIIGPYYLKVFCSTDETIQSNIETEVANRITTPELKRREKGQFIYRFYVANFNSLINYLNSNSGVQSWGIQGPDRIWKLQVNDPLTLIQERKIIIATLEDLDEIQDPVERQQAYYQRDPITGKPLNERYDATGTTALTIYGSWIRALEEARQSILKDIVIDNLQTNLEYTDYLIGTYRRYHNNGYLWRTESYKNTNKGNKSLLQGSYLEYHSNGKLKIKGAFNNDLLNGPYREFYESGLAKCQGTLANGKLNGEYVQWDELGDRQFKAYFINGSLANSYVLDYEVFASLPG